MLSTLIPGVAARDYDFATVPLFKPHEKRSVLIFLSHNRGISSCSLSIYSRRGGRPYTNTLDFDKYIIAPQLSASLSLQGDTYTIMIASGVGTDTF